MDLHKYAYAPKGTSILLHRTPALRAPQFFASADWPGYTMLNATMQSTKSGGPLAAAWAVVNTLGDAGYATLSAQVFEAVDRIVAGIGGPLRVVVPPDSTLVALATDDSCDPFTICDEMAARGWYVQPQMSYAGSPATIHLSVSAATLASVEDFLTALGASVQAAVAAGPVRVDPDVVAFIEALDPAALSDDDFDGLLAASGLVSGRPASRAASTSPSGWPRSTRCSTSPPRPCGRHCSRPSSTASPAPPADRRAASAPKCDSCAPTVRVLACRGVDSCDSVQRPVDRRTALLLEQPVHPAERPRPEEPARRRQR